LKLAKVMCDHDLARSDFVRLLQGVLGVAEGSSHSLDSTLYDAASGQIRDTLGAALEQVDAESALELVRMVGRLLRAGPSASFAKIEAVDRRAWRFVVLTPIVILSA
jgi:hypothetical protein